MSRDVNRIEYRSISSTIATQIKYVLSDSIDFKGFHIWEYLHRLFKLTAFFLI